MIILKDKTNYKDAMDRIVTIEKINDRELSRMAPFIGFYLDGSEYRYHQNGETWAGSDTRRIVRLVTKEEDPEYFL